MIRVTCCTICGSDLHTFTGRRSAHDRSVLGHEIIGEVVCWGGDQAPRDYFGEKIRPGQRVTWSMPVGCGGCFFCRNALSWKCDSLFKYGHEPCGDGIPTGGLSTHCRLIPKTPIFPIPDALPDEVACPANCATATVSATLRLVAQTHPIRGASVVITGAGMLGLSAIVQLVDLGAKEIIAVDPHSDRRELARTFGATLTVDSNSPGDVEKSVLAKTDNRGVDVAIDFSGISSAVETCLKHLRIGGCVLLAGSTFPSESLKLAPEQIVRRMITLRGSTIMGRAISNTLLSFWNVNTKACLLRNWSHGSFRSNKPRSVRVRSHPATRSRGGPARKKMTNENGGSRPISSVRTRTG